MQTALSVNEAVARAGVGKTKLYQLINSGALPVRKIGRKTLVLTSDLLS